MVNGLIGRKVGMTQIFDEGGNLVPVTVLQVGPCPVAQVKFSSSGAPRSAQLAFEESLKKDERKRASKPIRAHCAKHGIAPHRHLKEFAVDSSSDEEIKAGQTVVTVSLLKDVSHVNVTAVSKGKGFAGVVKRHHFKGAQTVSHGAHEAFRHGGSIGMCAKPARVLKGTKMAGRMGAERVTTRGLEVARLFEDENLLLVKGATPGARGAISYIVKSTSKRRAARELDGEPSAKFVNPLKASKRRK